MPALAHPRPACQVKPGTSVQTHVRQVCQFWLPTGCWLEDVSCTARILPAAAETAPCKSSVMSTNATPIGTSSPLMVWPCTDKKSLLLPAANCPRTYLVSLGDSCSSIELRNALSTSTFQSLNPNVNCNLLLAGAPVCLPAAGVRCTVCPLLYMGRIGRLGRGIVCQ